MWSLKTVLVATDFSEPARTALTYGRELARQTDAQLHVLHVADDLGAKLAGMSALSGYAANLDQLQADIEKAAREDVAKLVADLPPSKVTVAVVTALAPAEAILSYARDVHADLIVLGTHGRSGVAHLLIGSVAERIVRLAPCPVLTVRHPEREFVVAEPAGAAVARAR